MNYKKSTKIKLIRCIFALLMVISFLSSSLMGRYGLADTVVIGNAPNSNANFNNGVLSSSNYMAQAYYSGPGTIPSSAVSGVNTPINYDSSTSDTGPTTHIIKSPADNEAEMAHHNSNVIGTKDNLSSSTADVGPTSRTIDRPLEEGMNPLDTNSSNGNTGPRSVNYNPAGTSATGNVPYFYTNGNTPQGSGTGTGVGAQVVATGLMGGIDLNYNASGQNLGQTVYTAVNINAAKPTINSDGAILVNATTKEVYYSKNPFTAYNPAGIANLMTAYLLVSSKQLTDVLMVTPEAVNGLESGAARAGLRAGDTITVADALGAMFVKSCCDVSNTVAINVAGSIPNFVALMNNTAVSMGCIATHFANPTGLNDVTQVTNPYDMAVIMDYVSNNPTLKQYLTITMYQLPATAHRRALMLYSKNTLLSPGSSTHYSGISASRLGYTSKALYTMASELDYNGNKLIAVVMRSNGTQFADTTKLLNFGKTSLFERVSAGGAVAAAQAQANQTQMQLGNSSTLQQSLANNGLSTNVSTANVGAATAANSQGGGTWLQNNGRWYYVNAAGQIVRSQWLNDKGKNYYLDSSGFMVTGWQTFSNGNTYYFDPVNGDLKTNTWVNLSDGSYYLQSDGTLVKANQGQSKNITTSVGTYTINDQGKAIAKVN